MAWVAHVSDLHLRPEGKLAYGAIDTNLRARGVLAAVQALPVRPAVLVVSGDVADEGEPDAYEFARALLEALSLPVVLTPGNHDDPEAMRRAFGPDLTLGPQPAGTAPRVVSIDTCVPGEGDGAVRPADLARIAAALGAGAGPALVCLHHPPGIDGSGEARAGALVGEAGLADVIRAHPSVAGVLAGHLHRARIGRWAGVAMVVAPAVGYGKLVPPAHPPEGLCTEEPPAFLLHEIDSCGQLATQVLPVGEAKRPLRLRGGRILPL